jgi:hypothetical protein
MMFFSFRVLADKSTKNDDKMIPENICTGLHCGKKANHA